MELMHISRQTARRFILGRQGLWPGRRWRGKDGAADALRQAEAVQVDTISVLERNHDLVLWSRVAEYETRYLDELLFQDRLFFDYGGILMIYPVEELPFWRTVMVERRKHWKDEVTHLEGAIEVVRRELRERGPLASRDIAGGSRTPGRYRGSKDTGLALYALWQLGELMSHSRRGSDRVYDFTERVLGLDALLLPPVSIADVEIAASEREASLRYFALKTLRDLALATPAEWWRRFRPLFYRSGSTPEGRALLEQLAQEGLAAKVRVEGRKDVSYLPAEDLPLLRRLEAGETPEAWRPLNTNIADEVNLIAPLDNVIWDRARTSAVFDFDYTWEVYKPAHQRRYGYYTMPVLYGDRLVGRVNPRLDRKAGEMVVDGLWLEDASLGSDDAFNCALEAGLHRFAQFHGASAPDVPEPVVA